MKIIELTFRENPAEFTAAYIKESGFNPFETLLVSPTERFKSYFASYLLDVLKTKDIISPKLITMERLIQSILASKGVQTANDAQRFTMFSNVCKNVKEIEEIFPKKTFENFLSFKNTALRLLKVFDELNGMEIDITHINENYERFDFYHLYGRHFKVFQSIYRSYRDIQKELEIYDSSFLIQNVAEEDIEAFFSDYKNIILVSPLSLTNFEKRIYDTVNEKLTVVYQDTDEYDFSKILTFKNKHERKATEEQACIKFFTASSRMDEVMIALSIIRREIEAGTRPDDILVLNIDSNFCEMLYKSLESIGIASNYSEGIMIKETSLFIFLNQVVEFFKSDFDSAIFLEILRNDFFVEIEHSKDNVGNYKNLRNEIIRKRVFKLQSLKSKYIQKDQKRKSAFSLLYGIYESKNFEELHKNLKALFSYFERKKTYDFYATRDIVLNSVLELSDCTLDVKERPFEILLQYIKSKRYPLLGSYSQSLQILGLLETRGIAFKVVIVPTFNEGFFPKQSIDDLFLNSEMRLKLGLSTLLDRESLEFYYLKRVIDVAYRAYFIKITDKAADFDVESRFSYLIKGSEDYPDSHILPVPFSGKAVPFHERSKLALHKTERFSRLDIERLKVCETQYYIAKVLQIKDEFKLRTEIEMDLLGQKVHELFKQFYKDMDFEILPSFSIFEKRFDELFQSYLYEGLFYTNEEVLLKKILKTNLKEALRGDWMRFQKGYRVCKEHLEKEFSAGIERGEKRYELYGRIDRIDRTPEGGFLILDYKAGRVPEARDHFEEAGFKKIQLGFYGLLFHKSYPDASIEGLAYFDLNKKRDFDVIVSSCDIEHYLGGFESYIFDFLDSFNAKSTLSLTDDYDNCKYCPYYNICRIYEE